MAAKSNRLGFDTFARSVQKGPLCPVYAFVGENAYFAHQGTEALRDRFVRDHAADAINVFVGDEPPEVIFDHLRTADLFASRRLVIILRAELFIRQSAEPLEYYLEHPTAGSVLALVCAKLDARTKLARRIAAVGQEVACDKLYPDKLAAWVRDRFKAAGKPCESAVAEALVDELGDDLFALSAEVEKLCTYVGQRGRVNVEDVHALVGHDRTWEVFALTDAVGRRDTARALNILADLFAAGEAPELLVGQLGWQLRRLWTAVRLLQQGTSPQELGRQLRVHPRFLDGFIQQVRHFTERELAHIFRQLVQTDLALKTGQLDRNLAMETFVVQACSKEALAAS